MRFQPAPPPKDPERLAQWAYQQFQRLAQTLIQPEAQTVNYGIEQRNDLTTSAVNYTLDWKARQKQGLFCANSATVTLAFAPPEGVCNLMLRIVQDGTGSRAFTFPASVKWQGGTEPTWSQSASAVDVIACYYDGTSYHCTASLNSS